MRRLIQSVLNHDAYEDLSWAMAIMNPVKQPRDILPRCISIVKLAAGVSKYDPTILVWFDRREIQP